jgi:hypothetical protein
MNRLHLCAVLNNNHAPILTQNILKNGKITNDADGTRSPLNSKITMNVVPTMLR